MTDHDLLELAAKAMQVTGDTNFCNYEVLDHAVCLELGSRRGAITSYWKPLTDNGDAFRLMVSLGICTGPNLDGDIVVAFGKDGESICEPYGTNPYAATRRAIVRVAAETGRKIP